jgi:hypothetical protein
MDRLFLFVICMVIFALGIWLGQTIKPVMRDVVTLDNRRCILIYEQDVVHKFCEAK